MAGLTVACYSWLFFYNVPLPDNGMHHQGGGPVAVTTRHPSEDYPTTRMSTQSSSQLLYMVLGIVLGVMMLLLVIFMVMCAWKQRQQRRMMGAWSRLTTSLTIITGFWSGLDTFHFTCSTPELSLVGVVNDTR